MDLGVVHVVVLHVAKETAPVYVVLEEESDERVWMGRVSRSWGGPMARDRAGAGEGS